MPFIFACIYIYELVRFQHSSEFLGAWDILFNVSGFGLGALTGFLITITRSLNTYKKEYAELEVEIEPRKKKKTLQPWRFNEESDNQYLSLRVDFVLIYPWKIRRVRKVEHYRRSILLAVFRQHQRNALILELIALEIVILLGFLMEWPVFRLPAAVSIFLLMAILIGPIGAFFYWLRSWATPVFVLLFVFYNSFPLFNQWSHHNQLFGMNYDGAQKPYSSQTVADCSTDEKIHNDSLLMIDVMNKWKAKATMIQHLDKPKLVMLDASGGGMRSSVLSFFVMQQVDSISNKTFLDNVLFITGASGGSLGLSYFRELYRLRKLNPYLNLHDKKYEHNISKDLLNAVCAALVVNDMLVPWQKFMRNGHTYTKDRGYLWEKQLNENTDNVLNKQLGDYADDERNAIIPFIVYTPTIINDGKAMNVSNLPLAFLNRNKSDLDGKPARPDGIDAMNFFGETETRNMSFTSIIRTNCTFPYIMPTVFMPSQPSFQCMDAGMRDNYGMEATLRFMYFFRDWINENTSGVVLIQTRDFPKNYFPEISSDPSWVSRRVAPVSAIYSNWMEMQDFRNEALMASSTGWLQHPLQLVSFEYIPAQIKNAASMSWHLTSLEKADVLSSLYTEENQKQMHHLMNILGYK